MHTVLPDDAHGGETYIHTMKHPYNGASIQWSVPGTRDYALVRESHHYRLGLMRDLAM